MANHTILGGAGTTTITMPVTGGGFGGVTGAGTGYSFTSGSSNTAVGYTALNNVSYTTTSSPLISTSIANNSLEVTGNANFKGDVTIDGISVKDTLKKINERLAILVPDPKKLEQYEALQKAYKNYKMLEALCEVREDEPE